MIHSNKNEYKTINTFSRTPSLAQICSYCIIALQTAIFYSVVQSSLVSQEYRVILICLYSVTIAVVVVSTFVCSYSDPSDKTMIEYRKGNHAPLKNQLDSLLFCEYCQSYVQANTRHCR